METRLNESLVDPRIDSAEAMLLKSASALASILLHPTSDPDKWFDRCGQAVRALVAEGPVADSPTFVRVGAWSPLSGWIGRGLIDTESSFAGRSAAAGHLLSSSPERVFSRADVVDDIRWAASDLAKLRAAERLGEFVEGHFAASWIGGPCVFLLTADLRLGAEWDERRIMTVFSCLGPAIRDGFVDAVANPARRRADVMQRVSASQRPILERLVNGVTERVIAEQLTRSPHTVHDHVKAIYQALGVSSRHELVELWNGRVKGESAQVPVLDGRP